ncbi:M24 family metallopeptidase [Corynebacterium heidelbergense]|uniref:Peptidase M24 family protein n=1 Tax=Corynebacterium heidelbergense TaxID=2055947 RepID=A0A364V7F8_9CORY|nr:Xaa-Pro peptidase family protein [Corynebacterium heidelbergense]RAV32600.1 peptidase M24 family protein [Corynebacterium heidelbergense]
MSDSFPLSTYARRLDQAARLAADAGLDGIIATPGPDLEFLIAARLATHERFAGLLLTPTARRLIVPAVDAASLKHSPAGQLGIDIVGWQDGEDPYGHIPAGRFAVSPAMTADHLLRLQGGGVSAVNATGVLSGIFVIKDANEIAQLRHAAEAIDDVHRAVPALLRPGVTEKEVAEELDQRIIASHGTTDFVIVGSGPHGADPHHDYSDRQLQPGDIVVVDIGGTLPSGYHSDCTRMYVVGEPTAEQQRIYDVLRQAQEAGVAFARPGVTAAQVDRVVREVIENAGYGEAFIHRTGHGIGLSCHEEPSIMAGNDLELKEGMAFSIEPGVYFPGQWGARIEDIVVLTSDGAQPLNRTTHDLVRVPSSA